jgi:hypothetical protein
MSVQTVKGNEHKIRQCVNPQPQPIKQTLRTTITTERQTRSERERKWDELMRETNLYGRQFE